MLSKHLASVVAMPRKALSAMPLRAAAAATRPTMQERSPGSHRSQHVAVRSVSSDANNRNSNIRLPSSAPSFASQSMSHLITMLREEAMAPGRKVAIIGAAGNVGASVVFSLISTSFPMDIMLADVNEKLARGQAMDLADAAWPSSHRVRYADIQEAGQADLIIITAGARQKPGETRDDLLDRNHAILQSILDGLKPINPKAVLLMISNPVDVLTAIAQHITELPKCQVFGSGTLLDSGRLRNYLSKLINVRQTSIHCHMLGEHGDGQFVGWSSARIGGVKLDQFPEMEMVDKQQIEREIARTAYSIIEAKGATYYGVGVCGAILATSVLQNSHDIQSVSCYSEKWGGYVSTPAVLFSNGIDRVLELDLDEEETAKMENAVARIKDQTRRFIQ